MVRNASKGYGKTASENSIPGYSIDRKQALKDRIFRVSRCRRFDYCPMSDERIIKKYPNRRLYDTEVSKYITVADVRTLVMKGAKFRVVDTTNEEDITRSILLQIMLEEESAGNPLFTANMLDQIIRFYGGTLHGLFACYLEQALNVFAKQQHQVHETLVQDPLETVARVTQCSVETWADFQKEFLRAAGLQTDKSEK